VAPTERRVIRVHKGRKVEPEDLAATEEIWFSKVKRSRVTRVIFPTKQLRALAALAVPAVAVVLGGPEARAGVGQHIVVEATAVLPERPASMGRLVRAVTVGNLREA
jgi:hypothetical protein